MGDRPEMTIPKLCTCRENILQKALRPLSLIRAQVALSKPCRKQRLCVTKVCLVVPNKGSCKLHRAFCRAPSLDKSVTPDGAQGGRIVLNWRKSFRLVAIIKSRTPVPTLDLSGCEPNVCRDFQTQIISRDAMLKGASAVGET